MNTHTIIAFLVVVAAGFAAYYSMQPKSETTSEPTSTEESKESGAETNTAQRQNTASTPSAPSAPAAAPVATAESSRFCPKFGAGAELGTKDGPVPAGGRGDVSNLQVFLQGEYGLGSGFVTGTFDSETENYLKRWQRENNTYVTGVLNSESMQLMLKPCVGGVIANGVEYAKQSFSLTAGKASEQLVHVHEALVAGGGNIESGAPRIELISAYGSTAELRVTAATLGGLRVERFALAENGTKTTGHSQPITIKVVNINSAGAILSVSR